MTDILSHSAPDEYSHKLDDFFTLPLSDEDMRLIETLCTQLGFDPAPRRVGRALHRFAVDTIKRGLVSIHAIYNTYNATPISLALGKPENPVTQLLNHSGELTKEEEETLAIYRAKYGLNRNEAILELLRKQLYLERQCGFNIELQGEVEDKQRRA